MFLVSLNSLIPKVKRFFIAAVTSLGIANGYAYFAKQIENKKIEAQMAELRETHKPKQYVDEPLLDKYGKVPKYKCRGKRICLVIDNPLV